MGRAETKVRSSVDVPWQSDEYVCGSSNKVVPLGEAFPHKRSSTPSVHEALDTQPPTFRSSPCPAQVHAAVAVPTLGRRAYTAAPDTSDQPTGQPRIGWMSVSPSLVEADIATRHLTCADRPCDDPCGWDEYSRDPSTALHQGKLAISRAHGLPSRTPSLSPVYMRPVAPILMPEARHRYPTRGRGPSPELFPDLDEQLKATKRTQHDRLAV